MSQYVGEDGRPLRHDGTPFPDDSSLWSPAEWEYLRTYWFGFQEDEGHHANTVAAVDIPEIQHQGGGSAIA